MAQETVSLEAGPSGVKGTFTGEQILPVLLTLLMGAWVWFCVIYVQDARSAEREKARIVATDELTRAIKELTAASEKQNKTGKAVIYVLTMPQKEREKLNLARPDVLYEMQRYER